MLSSSCLHAYGIPIVPASVYDAFYIAWLNIMQFSSEQALKFPVCEGWKVNVPRSLRVERTDTQKVSGYAAVSVLN
jgi:hypothetical protein